MGLASFIVLPEHAAMTAPGCRDVCLQHPLGYTGFYTLVRACQKEGASYALAYIGGSFVLRHPSDFFGSKGGGRAVESRPLG